jgi:tetratricopeptide (TPR) repeat protein
MKQIVWTVQLEDNGMKLFLLLLTTLVFFAVSSACFGEGTALDRADAEMAKKHYADACAQYQQLVNGQPMNVPLLLKFSQALEGKGDLDAAIARARQATQIEPESVQAHLLLAHYLDANRDETGAVAQYERCLELNSTQSARRSVYGPLIRLENKLGDQKKLLEVAKQFVKEFPNDAVSHYDLAWVMTQIPGEKRFDSIREYKKSLQLNDNLLSARYNLAILLHKDHRDKEALQELETFVSHTTEDDPDMSAAMELAKKLKEAGF